MTTPNQQAIEAGAKALHAHGRQLDHGIGQTWEGDLTEWSRRLIRAEARAVLTAALPALEQQIREQVAQEIEAARPAVHAARMGGKALHQELTIAARIARGEDCSMSGESSARRPLKGLGVTTDHREPVIRWAEDTIPPKRPEDFVKFDRTDAPNMYRATFDVTGYVNKWADGFSKQMDDALAPDAIEVLRPWLIAAGWTPPVLETTDPITEN